MGASSDFTLECASELSAGITKIQISGLHSRAFNSIGLGCSLGFCILSKFPEDADVV